MSLCNWELKLEIIQTQMTQKPMLRAGVHARALRASRNRKEDSVHSVEGRNEMADMVNDTTYNTMS
jgi:hypothetical protein